MRCVAILMVATKKNLAGMEAGEKKVWRIWLTAGQNILPRHFRVQQVPPAYLVSLVVFLSEASPGTRVAASQSKYQYLGNNCYVLQTDGPFARRWGLNSPIYCVAGKRSLIRTHALSLEAGISDTVRSRYRQATATRRKMDLSQRWRNTKQIPGR